MARKAIYNYIFTPGAANSGTIIFPDPYKLSDILMITNVTTNTVIYNFADPNRGAYAFTYTNATDATDTSAAGTALSAASTVFSNLNNGYTTLTLKFNTTGMSATDSLQIYVETNELKIRPYDFGVDAVERMKIAAPQSLIDADFEYGLQATKWVQFPTANDIPMAYEQPGTDIGVQMFSYPTFLTGFGAAGTYLNGTTVQNVMTVNQGDINLFNGPRMAGATNSVGGAITGYAMIIAQGQAGMPNAAAGTTSITNQLPVVPQFGGAAQRTFSVANTTGFQPGDVACVVEMPGEGVGGSTTIGSNVISVTTGTLAAGATSLSTNATTAFGPNTIVFVETTQYGTWEAMAVGQSTSSPYTVIRNLWGTNAGNATIPSGARIRQLGGNSASYGNANVEVMRIDSVDSATQLTVTRSWFNTNASPSFGANSIMFKVNHTANSAANMGAGNIEIVRFQANSAGAITNSLTTQVITNRGMYGTTPLPYAGPGSLFIPLTGIFYAGNTSVPQVGVFAPSHNISSFSNANIGTCYISTIGISQAVTVSNVEGVFINQIADTQYLKYYPKVGINQLPGHQLNINDVQTVIRRGSLYSGANIVVANITSNIGSPSLITVNTLYPHGLIPGQAIQAQIHVNAAGGINYANVVEGGTGQFVIQSTPTPTTFQYVGKPNVIVQSTGVQGLAGNITLFATGLVKHRPIDGGNNIGTNTPAHGYEMTRQTKKAFRYQSGKGTMFTTGTQFNPVFTIANITATGTTSGSTINITTENEHGLQVGANVALYGIATSGYNTYYRVSAITNSNQLQVLVPSGFTLGATQPTWTVANQGTTAYAGQNYPRVVAVNWHGAKVRSGIFDDGNGVFYEYDGSTFYAVKRTSTADLSGRVNIAVGSNLLTGDANTRFTDQINAGDQVIIRGMTHTITQVVDQNHAYVIPVYRGTVNAQDVRFTRIQEERTPQKAFNLDRADGTGPSGYVMNLTKMQMVGIQYTWYGAGFVDYMMRGIDGKMHTLHRSKGNNTNDEAYMRTGNLPARYQAVNKGPRTWTSKAVTPTATEIQLYNVSEFPTANASYPVTLMIDNELIKYTGVFTANGNITGVSRGVTNSQYILGASRSLWSGSNAGVNWIGQGMPAQGPWSAQAYNPNASTFVAISGYPNNSSSTAYSSDGISWTAGGNLPSSSTWIDLAYGRIGTTDYMVAVSNESVAGWGKGAYSTDNGATWSNISIAPTTTTRWSSIAFGYDQLNTPIFVAVAGIGANSAATAKLTVASLTPNGTGAAATNLNITGPWTKITFGQVAVAGDATTSMLANVAKQNFFVTVGAKDAVGNVQAANFTTDGGTTWGNIRLAPSLSGYTDVKYGGGLWMAVAGGLDQPAQGLGLGLGATSQTLNGACFIYGNPSTGSGTQTGAGALALTNASWTAMQMPGVNPQQWRSLAYGPVYTGSQLGAWFCIQDTTTIDNVSAYGGHQAARVNNMDALSAQGSVVPTWSSVSLPQGASWTNITWGNGLFSVLNGNVAPGANSYATAITTTANTVNGNVFLSTIIPGGGNIQAIAYGVGNLVAISTNSSYANISYNGGRHWANVASATAGATAGFMGASTSWKALTYAPLLGNVNQGRFVAIAGGSTSSQAMALVDASNLNGAWQYYATGMSAAQAWNDVTFINGAFVCVGSGSTLGTATTISNYNNQGGVGGSWTAVTIPSNSWNAVASGPVPSLAGTTGNIYAVVAVGNAASGGTTTTAAYSNVIVIANNTVYGTGTTGTSVLSLWGQSTLPSNSNWSSVAYGNGYFIAIATNGTATAVSTNGGATWTAGGALPSSQNWNKVAYGANGVWVAVSSATGGVRGTAAAYSVDNGTTWTASTLPSAQNWTGALYATQHNNWVAVGGDATNASGNVAISLNTGGLGASHTANTGVRVVSVTASPDLNHWGSAVIMDGGFTVDRTYTFTYNQTNFTPLGTQVAGAAFTVFLMRLAPSLSNALTGNLGVKDLINRAQVLLNNMYINVGGAAARFLVQGLLNPTNIANANWQPLNATANFLQPSFTQFVANIGGTNPYPTTGAQITFTTGTAAAGGEQLFSIPVSQGTAGFLDLSNIKEITGMVLPGTGNYPNGPEVLAINLIPVVVTQSNVDVQITFIESQA
jgi:hypothetical protein